GGRDARDRDDPRLHGETFAGVGAPLRRVTKARPPATVGPPAAFALPGLGNTHIDHAAGDAELRPSRRSEEGVGGAAAGRGDGVLERLLLVEDVENGQLELKVL